MKVVLIGSGNVNATIGKACYLAGYKVVQIFNRTPEHAASLGTILNSPVTNNIDEIVHDADIYIISVSDNALADVAAQLRFNDVLVVHTTGTAPLNILCNCSSRTGVLYPLQTLRKEKEELPVLPFFIDGNTEEVKQTLYSFAKKLSSIVDVADDVKRMKLHLAAVVVSNFTNHLFAQAEFFCKKEDVAFNFLFPLIEETVNRMRHYSPSKMQTGPAIRKDETTIQKHLTLLKSYPKLHELYKHMTKSIQTFNF